MMGAYAQSDFDTLYRDSYNNLLRLAYCAIGRIDFFKHGLQFD